MNLSEIEAQVGTYPYTPYSPLERFHEEWDTIMAGSNDGDAQAAPMSIGDMGDEELSDIAIRLVHLCGAYKIGARVEQNRAPYHRIIFSKWEDFIRGVDVLRPDFELRDTSGLFPGRLSLGDMSNSSGVMSYFGMEVLPDSIDVSLLQGYVRMLFPNEGDNTSAET